MNILQINTADTKGGAAKIAYQLKNSLNKNGHNASMIVSRKYSFDNDVVLIRPYSNLRQRILKKLSYLLADDLDFFGSDRILEIPEFKFADIVHCHNLHSNYFNLATLERISAQKPIIWTLHDMWPITAHCGHSFNGKLKENGFYTCPDLDIYPPIAWHNEKYLENKKSKIYKNSNFHIVTPSKWLADKVNQSLLKNRPLTVIYNGVDTSVFKPGNKQECRQELELPQNKKIILFLAKRSQSNPWKGGIYANDALDAIGNRSDVFILDIGGDENKTVGNRKYISFINNENTLAKYYSASDILLYPSLADNCPLVALEAQACGLPLVTFKTGGIPEIIAHKETGYVAEYKDLQNLISGIKYCLDNNHEVMSKNSIQNALLKFTLNNMVNNYVNLYASLLPKKTTDYTRG